MSCGGIDTGTDKDFSGSFPEATKREGMARALRQTEARILQLQHLVKKQGDFIRRVRESKVLDMRMKGEAKTLEEQAQAACLEG